jgi:hypothetical protein
MALPLRSLVLAGWLSLGAGLAAAQTPPPPSPTPAPGPRREGFLIGFSLGSGFSETYEPAFDFHLGGMARPDLALTLEFYGVDKRKGRSAGIIGAGVQYWPSRRFWAKGGLGYGSVETDSVDDTDGEARLGALAGAGYELVQSGRFTLDVQARGVLLRGGSGASLGLGFNWY